jgi:Zn ribbon nucleic-acid-binding protein
MSHHAFKLWYICRKRRVAASPKKVMKQIPMIAFILTVSFGLVAQTQTATNPVTKKPTPTTTESKEHTTIRMKYEAEIKRCEGDDPLPSHHSDDPEFGKKYARITRSLNAKIALQRVKNDALDTGYDEKRFIAANQRVAACEQSELLEPKVEIVDSCISTYHQTIDKKNADLTVRESEQVKACQSLDLYPPAK